MNDLKASLVSTQQQCETMKADAKSMRLELLELKRENKKMASQVNVVPSLNEEVLLLDLTSLLTVFYSTVDKV